MTKEKYSKTASERAKQTNVFANLVKSFFVGGSICILGRGLAYIYQFYSGTGIENANILSTITLIFLSGLLTGLGIFDKIAKHAGAGTLVPITGFSNAVSAPAIESKSEGFINGVGAKMFVIAGPVIVYGVVASVLYGVIYYFFILYLHFLFVVSTLKREECYMGKIIKFKNVYIRETASIVGTMEGEGPLRECFDLRENDMRFGASSWEMAESEMSRRCVELLFHKSGIKPGEASLITGGDLLNQCIASAFAVSGFEIPFLGLYGACSTCVEGLIVASVMAEKTKKDVISFASSHFCSAEKQYRFPLEYGGQRTPTSQSTVTGCGSFLLSNKGKIRVSDAMVGMVRDGNIYDANNMGAAMAPAAVDTLLRYFKESGTSPSDYDVIATGDLGVEGHELAKELLLKSQIVPGDSFVDCGILIYDMNKQDVHSGGSGCGCSAVVTAGHFFSLLKRGSIRNMLLIGTGALLSKISSFQGNVIPAVAHLVKLESVLI